MVRGEVFRLPPSRATRGHEQPDDSRAARSSEAGSRAGGKREGARYAVVLQADEFLHLSTTIVAPTSTSARPASFRPAITLDGRQTRVLVEQTTIVDPQRLGKSAGRLEASELRAADVALMLILGL